MSSKKLKGAPSSSNLLLADPHLLNATGRIPSFSGMMVTDQATGEIAVHSPGSGGARRQQHEESLSEGNGGGGGTHGGFVAAPPSNTSRSEHTATNTAATTTKTSFVPQPSSQTYSAEGTTLTPSHRNQEQRSHASILTHTPHYNSQIPPSPSKSRRLKPHAKKSSNKKIVGSGDANKGVEPWEALASERAALLGRTGSNANNNTGDSSAPTSGTQPSSSSSLPRRLIRSVIRFAIYNRYLLFLLVLCDIALLFSIAQTVNLSTARSDAVSVREAFDDVPKVDVGLALIKREFGLRKRLLNRLAPAATEEGSFAVSTPTTHTTVIPLFLPPPGLGYIDATEEVEIKIETLRERLLAAEANTDGWIEDRISELRAAHPDTYRAVYSQFIAQGGGGRITTTNAQEQLLVALLEAQNQLVFFARPQLAASTTAADVQQGSALLSPLNPSDPHKGTLRSRILVPLSRAYLLVTRKITRNVDWGGLTGTYPGGHREQVGSVRNAQIGWSLIVRDLISFGAQLMYMLVPPGQATVFDPMSSSRLYPTTSAAPTTTTVGVRQPSSDMVTGDNSFAALKMAQFNQDLMSCFLTRPQVFPTGNAGSPRTPSLTAGTTFPNTTTWNDIGFVAPSRATTTPSPGITLLTSAAMVGNFPVAINIPLRYPPDSRLSGHISLDIRSRFQNMRTSLQTTHSTADVVSSAEVSSANKKADEYYVTHDALVALSAVSVACIALVILFLVALLWYHNTIRSDDQIEEKFTELENSLKLIPRIASVLQSCTSRDSHINEVTRDAKLIQRLLLFIEAVRPYIQQSLFGEVESLTATHQQQVAGGAMTALSSGADAVSKLLDTATSNTPKGSLSLFPSAPTAPLLISPSHESNRMNISQGSVMRVPTRPNLPGSPVGDHGVLGGGDLSLLPHPSKNPDEGSPLVAAGDGGVDGGLDSFNMHRPRAQGIDPPPAVAENSASDDIYEDEGGFEVLHREYHGVHEPSRSTCFVAKSAILANMGGGGLHFGVPGLDSQMLSGSLSASANNTLRLGGGGGGGGVALGGRASPKGGGAIVGNGALTTVDFRLTELGMSQAFRELHMRDLRRESTIHICSGVVMMITSPILTSVPLSEWDDVHDQNTGGSGGPTADATANSIVAPDNGVNRNRANTGLPQRRGARRQAVDDTATAETQIEMEILHLRKRSVAAALRQENDIDITFDALHQMGPLGISPPEDDAVNGSRQTSDRGGQKRGKEREGWCLSRAVTTFIDGSDAEDDGVSELGLGSRPSESHTSRKTTRGGRSKQHRSGGGGTDFNNGLSVKAAVKPLLTGLLYSAESNDWKLLETVRTNRLIQIVEECVNGAGGVVHSLGGEGFVALWNVNNSSTKPVASASLAAFKIVQRLNALLTTELFASFNLPPEVPPISISIGSSLVLAGNILMGAQGRNSMLLAGPSVLSCSASLNSSLGHRAPIVVDHASMTQLSSMTFAEYDHVMRPIGICIPPQEVIRIRKRRKAVAGLAGTQRMSMYFANSDSEVINNGAAPGSSPATTSTNTQKKQGDDEDHGPSHQPSGGILPDSINVASRNSTNAPQTTNWTDNHLKLSGESGSLSNVMKDGDISLRGLYDYLEEHGYIVYALAPAREMRTEKLRQWLSVFREIIVLYICLEDVEGALRVLQRYRVEFCGAVPDESYNPADGRNQQQLASNPNAATMLGFVGVASPHLPTTSTNLRPDPTADIWYDKLLKAKEASRIRETLRDRTARQFAATAAAVAAAQSGKRPKRSKRNKEEMDTPQKPASTPKGGKGASTPPVRRFSSVDEGSHI